MKSIQVSAHNLLKYLINVEEIDAICHDLSLNRRCMKLFSTHTKQRRTEIILSSTVTEEVFHPRSKLSGYSIEINLLQKLEIRL